MAFKGGKKKGIKGGIKQAVSKAKGIAKRALPSVAAAGIGFAASRAMSSRQTGRRVRRSSVTLLKNRLMKRLLKIKLIQADRRLFKEQIKGV